MNKLQDTIAEQGPRLDGALAKCARGYLYSGTTLYEESVAGGSLMWTNRNAESIPQVVDWISKLNALRLDASMSSASSTSGLTTARTFSTVSPSTIDETETLPPLPGQASVISDAPPVYSEQAEGDDLDFEDELAIDSTAAALESGNAAFERNDYEEADSFLQEALTLVQALPVRLRSGYNLSDVHYKLAVSAFYLHDAATAQAALVTVVEQNSKSKDDGLRLCTAGHLLSQTYVRTGEFDLARATCENAYRGRRKILGKDHESCYESLALLARICALQGHGSRGKVYFSMIPAASQAGMSELFGKLDVEAGHHAPPMRGATSTSSFQSVERTMSSDSADSADSASTITLNKAPSISAVSAKSASGIKEGVVLKEPRACDLAWSSRGQYLACADRFANQITIVSTYTGHAEKVMKTAERKRIYSLALNPTGTILAVGYEDGTLELWNVKNGLLRKRFAGGLARHHNHAIGAMAFSHSGETLVSMCKAGRIVFFGVAANQLKHFAMDSDCAGTEGSLAFSPDDTLIAITTAKGADIWNVASGTIRASLTSHWAGPKGLDASHPLVGLAFTPDGTAIALGSGTNLIGVHKIDGTGEHHEVEISGIKRPALCFLKLAYSADGHLIAARTPPYFDEPPWVCDTENGKFEFLEAAPHAVTHLALSEDGALLATSVDDGCVRVLDLAHRLKNNE